VTTGICKIGEYPRGAGRNGFQLPGGVDGSVVGEKLTRLIEKATEKTLPLIIISTSGGARMYEACSAHANGQDLRRARLSCPGELPYISVLTHPTTAGRHGQLRQRGRPHHRRAGAMIGFAGPRVIKDTTQAELPPGFQTAEFLLDHGLIDAIVPRKEMKLRLIEYLNYMTAGLN